MQRNEQYWTQQDKLSLFSASTFSDLAIIALNVLAKMPKPISEVCGPISTGGLGSIEKNIEFFDAVIGLLMKRGLTVFDQMPFQEHIFRIVQNRWGSRQNNQLLNEFYLPIFQSGLVDQLYFMPGWETSEGATWEHEQAQSLGIEIVYIFMPSLLSEGDRNVHPARH